MEPEEDRILLNLQPGDRFKVKFRQTNHDFINNRFLIYLGCWMEVVEKVDDYAGGTCAYYATCLEEHNPNRADQQDFAWGSCGTKEWRPGVDFTEVRKVGQLPAHVIGKPNYYLPDI